MNKRYYTRKEAADALGVSPQSVSNYASKGIIHAVRSGNYIKYPADEVDALKVVPELYTYEEIKERVKELEAKEVELMEEASRRLEARIEDFKAVFTDGHPQLWFRYRDLIMQVVRLASQEALGRREEEVLWSMLELNTLQEVADKVGVTRERVRQVYQRALLRIVRFREIATTRYEIALRTVEDLKKKNAELEATCWALMNPEPGKPAMEVANEMEKFRCRFPFTVRIKDLGLSVRCTNCLKAADVETLGDLVGYKKHEIYHFRNFGRKSLNELEELLYKYNLEFGMWRDPERKY